MSPGWTVGRHIADDIVRVFTPDGVMVPMLEGVGTDEEREAYADYQALKNRERYERAKARFNALNRPHAGPFS